MRLAGFVVSLAVLAGCAFPSSLKVPEPRLSGNIASFEGCSFKVAFSGEPGRKSFGLDALKRDYASNTRKSDVLDEAGFQSGSGGATEITTCKCLRYSLEGTASASDATALLRDTFQELAELKAAPAEWQAGTPMGTVASYGFNLANGTRVSAKVNFSGNCEGTVVAFRPGGGAAGAKKFTDSMTPL